MSTEARRLGKYELRERLAAGGMGEVWKAFDPQLRRYVAIKLLHADLRNDPSFTTRFTQEAQVVAALRHPNIVQIHDFDFASEVGSQDTTAYMVMDYIPGQTLADYIRATSRIGQFPSASDIVYLFTEISLGLDYAHAKGVIHRDIKPANILLDKRLATVKPMGEPVITDFGIARLQQGGASLTLQGALLGTPHYISPEQAQGRPGDHRSDLYSLGVVLYEMLTGTTPFHGDNLSAVLVQHITTRPTPPTLINPTVPPAASAVVLTSLEKEPGARFSSASALTTALAAALNVPTPTPFLHPLPSPEDTHASTYFSYPQAHLTAPTMPPVLTTTPETPPLPVGNDAYYRAQGAPSAISAPSQLPAPTRKPGRTRLFIILSAVLICALVTAGLGARAIFFPSTASNTPTAVTGVGHLTFVRSQQALGGMFDELEFDLANIPDPGTGQGYYAWLDSPCTSTENVGPHWALPITNHTIHTSPLNYPGYSNLFCPNANSILVISKETTNPPPIVPTDRLYYAHITQKTTTTFDFVPCPTGGSSSICESGS